MSRLRDITHRQVGRRGASLLFFGTLDLVYAWAMYTNDPAAAVTNSTYRWIDTIAPLDVWAVVWAVVGLVCLYHAFHHYDRFGFIAAIGIKVVWGLLCLAGVAYGEVSVGSVGIWLGLAGLVWIISGWREPIDYGDDAV